MTALVSEAKQVPVSDQDARQVGRPFDYADAFTIQLSPSDGRSAEQFARDALEGAGAPVRWLIRNVWRWVLGFQAGPGETPRILGMPVVCSTQEEVRLETSSELFSAVLLGTRPDPCTARLVTALTFRKPRSRALWAAVAPVHRRVARLLLRRSAARGY